MRVGPAKIASDGGHTRLSVRFHNKARSGVLWYAVESPYGHWLMPERLDPFLVALLPIAMDCGETLELDGPVSERLYYNITHYYMHILRAQIPRLALIPVVSGSLESAPAGNRPRFVATGCSCGIDSFSVLADHFWGDAPPGFKVSHLLFHNVGSHGNDQALFERRYERVRSFAEELSIPLVKINSNLAAIFGGDFETTMTTRNISAALVLQQMFGKYLHGSSFRYEDCFVGRTKYSAFSEPCAVHLFSTESMDCILAGSQYSRVEKTERVAAIEAARRHLDVCVSASEETNCSVCSKCARTLLTLEILGKVSLFSGVFNLDRYARIRRRYIMFVVMHNDPFSVEIREEAGKRDFRFPLVARLACVCRLRRVWGALPEWVRSIVKWGWDWVHGVPGAVWKE